MSIILFIIVIALLAMIISSTVRIVPQAHAYVVERLGAYQGTWSVEMCIRDRTGTNGLYSTIH